MKAPREDDFVVLIVSAPAMGLMRAQCSSAKSVRVMNTASDCDYSQPRKQMKSQHLSPANYSEMNASNSLAVSFRESLVQTMFRLSEIYCLLL